MKEERAELVRYRLEQAEESLQSARLLLDNGKHRPSVSRSYYSMFYAVLALLSHGGHRTSKHSGAIALFNREFVKNGVFDKELSMWLHEAFDLRQRSDYRELFEVSRDRAEDVLKNAGAFVFAVDTWLREAR